MDSVRSQTIDGGADLVYNDKCFFTSFVQFASSMRSVKWVTVINVLIIVRLCYNSFCVHMNIGSLRWFKTQWLGCCEYISQIFHQFKKIFTS